MRTRSLLFLSLALALLTAAPAAGQVTTAHMDSLRTAVSNVPANNANQRRLRQIALDMIARFRPLASAPTPPPTPTPQPPLDTSVVRVEVSPSSGPRILVGGTQQFAAQALDSSGTARKWAVTWNAGNPPVATITATGLARGLSAGRSDIRATAGGVVSAPVPLEVIATPAPIPPDPTEPGICTRTVANTTIQGNLVAAPGERLCIGPGVSINNGSVLVKDAVLQMRAGGSLTFVGANPDAYVGGGMEYSPALDSDRGLWVWGSGQLDISCTTKLGWNRTGSDPTWLPGDEYWIAPTNMNDYAPRRWTPGQPVPRVDPRLPATEVLNASRSCSITGPAHIHVHSTKSQRIEYVRLNQMGISNAASGGPVLGRYALHLHMMGEGSAGTIVRGVVAVDSRGKVFVPHASHGVTMIDNISINSWENCMWWDGGDLTNRLLIDRMACVGVKMPDDLAGIGNTFNRAFFLGAGNDMEIRNSVAAGVFDYNGYGVGFDWPDATGAMSTPGIFELLVWRFDTGNVAHNNRRGLRLWHVGTHAHVMRNVRSYRNAAGTENGSYLNANQYIDYVAIQDGYYFSTDLNPGANAMVWAGNTWPGDPSLNRAPSQMRNCVLESVTGAPLRVSNRQLPNMENQYALFEDCTLVAPVGQPTVVIGKPFMETCPWAGVFRRTNVLPEDIVIESNVDFHPCGGNEGTHIVIEHADGRVWDVRFTNGQKVVTNR